MAGDARQTDGMAGEEDLPEGFTLGLALVDAVPVALFCLAAIVLGLRLSSPLFVAGSVVAFVGGALKVGWKLFIALARRNVPWLSRQMRYVMPAGFALMLVGLLTCGVGWDQVAAAVAAFPSCVLLTAWLACMVAMGWFAGHLSRTDARANWVEQATNAVGQACLLAALLLMP